MRRPRFSRSPLMLLMRPPIRAAFMCRPQFSRSILTLLMRPPIRAAFMRRPGAFSLTEKGGECYHMPMNATEKMKTSPCILLDLDGTILDSMSIWRTAPAALLARRGIEPNAEQARVLRCVRFRAAVDYMMEQFDLGVPRDAVENEMRAMIQSGYRRTVFPKAGAEAFLQMLRRRGKRVAAVTDNDAAAIGYALAHNGLAKYFDSVYCAPSYGMSKQTPEIFELVLSREGFRAADCMLFDDAPWPLQTAKSLGIFTVAVEEPFSLHERAAICAAADAWTTDYSEFLQ